MPISRNTLLAALAVAALAPAAQAGGPFGVDVQINVPIGLPEVTLPGDVVITGVCPDPAAEAINASIAAAAPDGSWVDLAVTGVVRNNGGAYLSAPGQQAARMTTSGGAVLGESWFVALAPGEHINIAATIRIASGDEFVPDLQLALAYDPDIAIDGNPANDDCQSANNQTVLTAAQLQAIALGS